MESQSKTSVNPRREEELQPTNPIEKNRRPTDRSFLFLFLIVVIVWLGVSISGLCAKQRHVDDSNQSDYQFIRTLTACRSIFNAPIKSFSWILLLVLFSSIWFSIIAIILSRQFTKFCIYLGLAFYVIFVVYTICGYFFPSSRNNPLGDDKRQYLSLNIPHEFWLPYDISLVLHAIFITACLVSFVNIDQSALYNVIQDCCRVVLGSPSLMLFSGFISLLEFAVLSFTMNALISDLSSDRSIIIILLDCTVVILGSMWVLNFLFNFALMVISEYTVNYYWKNEGGIGRIIAQISRYHLGTIAFSSSLLVPYVCSFVQALKHKKSCSNTENYIFYFISKVLLTLSMPCTALYCSSIYGVGFIRSSQKAFDIVLRRCLLYLATLGTVDLLLSMAMIIVMIPAVIFGAVSVTAIGPKKEIDKTSDAIETQFVLLFYAIWFPVLTYGCLIYCSVRALLINKIIILNKENQCTEENDEILNRL